VEVEADLAAVRHQNALAGALEPLGLEFLELGEEAVRVEDDSGTDEVDAHGVDQARGQEVEAMFRTHNVRISVRVSASRSSACSQSQLTCTRRRWQLGDTSSSAKWTISYQVQGHFGPYLWTTQIWSVCLKTVNRGQDRRGTDICESVSMSSLTRSKRGDPRPAFRPPAALAHICALGQRMSVSFPLPSSLQRRLVSNTLEKATGWKTGEPHPHWEPRMIVAMV